MDRQIGDFLEQALYRQSWGVGIPLVVLTAPPPHTLGESFQA